MKDLQHHLQLALEAAHMATWDARIVERGIIDGKLRWSAPAALLLGQPARPFEQRGRDFLEYIDEDQRDQLADALQHCGDRNNNATLEFRMTWPDGTQHWLATRMRVLPGPDGTPQRVVGVLWDASRRMGDAEHQRDRQLSSQLTSQLSRQLNWQSTHDTLTGLINRREFETRLVQALAASKQHDQVHALLYLDLDQFKIINDTCGHEAGDVLLQRLARLLQAQMRETDILARLGGDELGILLTDCQPAQALAIAEHIRQSVKQFRFIWERGSFEIGVSIGLVHIDKNSKSMTELLIAADQACYQAKEQGRNRIHVYRGGDLTLAQRHGEMLWVARLSEAFEHGHFKLYAMPIVKLGAPAEQHEEVLIRIQNQQGDLIEPAAFIPAAERYDLMISIDRWVIKAVCLHLKARRDSLPPLAAFEASRTRKLALYSINLSGSSLGDPALHDYILEQFVDHEIAPEQICFEITETAAIADLSTAHRLMTSLQALGCRFSLDDFGSGLSSFAYLKALPVNYLKIDGAFIRDIATNPINRAMVKAINEVGHLMGILTVAEYVEDDATLAVVRELGIDYAQGYAVGGLRALTVGIDEMLDDTTPAWPVTQVNSDDFDLYQ
jgi:diguanylate cyclase (GGDEF)-like protein